MRSTPSSLSVLLVAGLVFAHVGLVDSTPRRLYGLRQPVQRRIYAPPRPVSKLNEDIIGPYTKTVEKPEAAREPAALESVGAVDAAFAKEQDGLLERFRPTTTTGKTNLFIITGIIALTASKLIMLPENPLKAYEMAVAANPVFVKACTSGVAYGLGDALSQVLLGKKVDDIDLWRSARSGTAGFIGHGPLCHYWMVWMENHLDFGGAWYAVFAKVIADQTIWSIYLNAMYASIIGFLAGKPLPLVWRDIKDTAWPALRSSWRFWPFIHLISFSKFIPLDLKLLWVDCMEVIWVIILSRVNNEQKDEAREAEAKTAPQQGNTQAI